MPITSAPQFRLMQAAKKGNLKSAGPSPAVAKEFLSKTSEKKKKMFAKAPR